ncbi:MAG: hypothetical protein R3A10_05315 [Caldilineaceae bacterium]
MRARQPKRHAPRFIALVHELTPAWCWRANIPRAKTCSIWVDWCATWCSTPAARAADRGILRLQHAPLVQRALRAFLVTQHENLMGSVAGLDERTLLDAEVAPGWSIRDTLVHVLAWHEHAYDLAHRGRSPPPMCTPSGIGWRPALPIDTVNVRLLEERADLDMIAIADGPMTLPPALSPPP